MVLATVPVLNPLLNVHCGQPPKRVAVGVAPLGLISIGIVPMGVVAIGVVPMGVVSLGAVAMGVVTGSVVGMGVLSAGVSTMGVWFLGSDAGSMGLVRLGPRADAPHHGTTNHQSPGHSSIPTMDVPPATHHHHATESH